MVNDVTALRAIRSSPASSPTQCLPRLMHMQGEARTMQVDPRYDDVASEVAAFLEERMAFASRRNR